MASKPIYYGIAVIGSTLITAGITNRSVLATFQDLIAGKPPQPGPGYVPGSLTPSQQAQASNSITPQPNSPTIGPQDLQGYAKQLLAAHGWSAQWESFNNLEMSEAGWDPLAENPTTGFFGLAQAGNHGGTDTASKTRKHVHGLHVGQLVNNYGGQGLTAVEAQQANTGNGKAQLKWMMNYIEGRYHDPNRAWMFHLSHGYY